MLHFKMMCNSDRQALAPLIITRPSTENTSDHDVQGLIRTAQYPEMRKEDLDDLDILDVFEGISDEDMLCSAHTPVLHENDLMHDLSDHDLLDCSAGADCMHLDLDNGRLVESDTDDVLSDFTEELWDIMDDGDQIFSSQSSIESGIPDAQVAVSPMVEYADRAELIPAAEVDMMLDFSEDDDDLLCDS